MHNTTTLICIVLLEYEYLVILLLALEYYAY